MQLLADSGSTKTIWQWTAGDGTVQRARTQGINPYYRNAEEIQEILGQELLPALRADGVAGPLSAAVSEIHFYGAGCSPGARTETVRQAMAAHFPQAQIGVESDLLGAARALCGHAPGIACVLGTGSGSCFYDGKRIVANIPSLGFVLGDEGGGAHIGKKFVTAFLRGELPQTTAERFQDEFSLTKEIVLQNVIHGPMPSRYLAGFAKFVSQQQHDPYVWSLIYESFNEFAAHYVGPYAEHRTEPVHFVGSVAFHNLRILESLARDRGFRMGTVLESPMDGLQAYHRT